MSGENEDGVERIVSETAEFPAIPPEEIAAALRPALAEHWSSGALQAVGEPRRVRSKFERLGGDPTTTLPPMGTLIATRYELGELIGRGSVADVYEARDLKTEEVHVLKIIRTEHVSDAELARIEDDAPRIQALRHPVLAELRDWGRWRDRLWVVAEALGGETVLEALSARGGKPLPVGMAALAARQVALGLASAHDAGVLHRDVKPSNVYLHDGGRFVKLADLGLPGPPLPLGEQKLDGSPGYIAPERITGGGHTPATDLFSLGVTLYEMFCGRRPFEGEDEPTLLFQIMQAEPWEPSRHEPGLPQGIDELVMALLRKDPADRPASGREVAESIRELPFVRF